MSKSICLKVSVEYQEADKNFVDYRLGLHPHFPLPMRNGAIPKPSGKNVAFIGAAQTFGRFVKHPYPELLEQPVGFNALNLGFAGVGPRFFLENQYLIDLANSTDAVIVQIMSGRSTQNSTIRYIEGIWKGSSTMTMTKSGQRVYAEDAWEKLLSSCEYGEIEALINETLSNYISEYIELLSLIQKPKILLWFSTESPDRSVNNKTEMSSFNSVAGSYPHFISRSQVEEIRLHANQYVEVVCKSGLPQQLFHRVSNQPIDRTPGDFRSSSIYNEYYPSPEMHMLCAYLISPFLRNMLSEDHE